MKIHIPRRACFGWALLSTWQYSRRTTRRTRPDRKEELGKGGNGQKVTREGKILDRPTTIHHHNHHHHLIRHRHSFFLLLLRLLLLILFPNLSISISISPIRNQSQNSHLLFSQLHPPAQAN
ncbi:hypothetical protein BDV34DRAFT_140953 [Aspergillus parasiticus]|uniref:Uncharacterized protein n=2 Tax=Aspergillus subgen. Circumdati TaxID=2720871 RepID=A0A5N6E0V2_ASPPA|nr:hypothetical protein BDV34DRAFT_140953 [Aspergillus parasiticus]KAE8318021.1 hypothetical protein BDV41DRAFT_450055 [Aspergillus transmontanensis]